MPLDPFEDAIYLKIEETIETNYRGADGTIPVSPSAVARLATAAALAAIEESRLTMKPADVRDAHVRAHLDGEFDAPANASGYTAVRHGLARVLPLVLAEERARVVELVKAAVAPPGAELHPEVVKLCEQITGGAPLTPPARKASS
ncbi:hypothetical protein GCM10022252_75630 [Streptosporangium oxazolinicum]|uniref:DUF222 domain-containing protein n=1 Tax=Streptosporangium oxazolinicum TaxID=909287 RepID=A0ABP8BKY5_9ACTN